MLTSCMRRAAALAAAALTLAACGSSTSPPARAPAPAPVEAAEVVAAPTATPGMTHTQFVKALNASCSRGKAKAEALDKRFQSAMERRALPEAGRTYTTLISLLRAHYTRISKFKPPAEDAAAMRRYMSAQRRIIGYGDRMSSSLLDDDLAGVNLLVDPFQRERKRRITAAIDIGADKCGS